MRISSKRVKVLLVLTFLALLLGTGATVCLVDDPPPEDADLRVAREALPDEENAFTCFEAAAKTLVQPNTDEDKATLEHLLSGRTWDAAFAEKTLAANRRALELWDQGLARPKFQLPEIAHLADLAPYLFEWLHLADIASLRSRHLAQTGHREEAYEEAMKLVTFGQRIEGAKGNLVGWLVGKVVKQRGLDQLRLLAAEAPLPPEQLRTYGDRLASLGTDAAGLANAIRMEYLMFCNTLSDIQSGRTPWSFLGSTLSMRQILRNEGGNVAIRSPYHFKPNRTKALAVAHFRSLVDQMPKTAFDAAPSLQRLKTDLTKRQTHFGSLSSRLFTPNSTGEVLLVMLTPSTRNIHSVKCQDNVGVGVTRLVLALRAFEAKNGHLPEMLDELVPDFIDAVPLDDFDGKPLRWSKERKILYSVGEDLVDDGGHEAKDSNSDSKDLVFHLDPRDTPQPEDEEADEETEEGGAAETPPETPAEAPAAAIEPSQGKAEPFPASPVHQETLP